MSSLVTSARDIFSSVCQAIGNKKVLLSLLISIIGSAFLLQLGYFVMVREMFVVDGRHTQYLTISDNGDWEPGNSTRIRVLTSFQMKYESKMTLNEKSKYKKSVVNIPSSNSHFNKSNQSITVQPIKAFRTSYVSKLALLMSFKSRIHNQIRKSMKLKLDNFTVLPTRTQPSLESRQSTVSVLSNFMSRLDFQTAVDLQTVTSTVHLTPEVEIVASSCVDCQRHSSIRYERHTPTMSRDEEIISWKALRRIMNQFLGQDRKRIISPTESTTDLESVALSQHRKEWRLKNREGRCQEWRQERQNWTAFVTGRFINSTSGNCTSPYEDTNIKRIVFSNFTEEFTGCTRHTPRCKERPHYDYTHKLRINVPPCCRNHLIQTYRNIEFELTRLDVKHFMIGGAVIGWMRNGRMIPYDDDLDVLVPMSFWKTDKFWEFVSTMRRHYKHPCRLVESTKMKIYYSEANDINIDMWPYEIIKPKPQRRRSVKRGRKYRKTSKQGNRLDNSVKTLKVKEKKRNKKKRKQVKRGKKKMLKVYNIESNEISRLPRKKRRLKRSTDLKPGEPYIDIPYYKFKRQPVSNLLPPKQVIFENFFVYFPNKPEAYLDRQYGEGNWVNELTCKDMDSDYTCLE